MHGYISSAVQIDKHRQFKKTEYCVFHLPYNLKHRIVTIIIIIIIVNFLE